MRDEIVCHVALEHSGGGLKESLGDIVAGVWAEESCPVLHEAGVDSF